MALYSNEQLVSLVRTHGRTWFDAQTGGIWFNWTCAGFTITFTGKTLRARVLAFGDEVPGPPGTETPIDYPCVGVVAEDGETLSARMKCTGGPKWYELFNGEEGTHRERASLFMFWI